MNNKLCCTKGVGCCTLLVHFTYCSTVQVRLELRCTLYYVDVE